MKKSLNEVIEQYRRDRNLPAVSDTDIQCQDTIFTGVTLMESLSSNSGADSSASTILSDTSYKYLSSTEVKESTDIQFENIPRALKERDQWVVWRYEWKEGKVKPDKVPYQVTGRKAMTNVPSTWSSFGAVSTTFGSGGYDGIGYVFGADDPYVGIDFDDIITDGIAPEYESFIQRFNSYTEITPSMSGVHIVVSGTLPSHGRRKGSVEIYSEGRFFTFTGYRLEYTSPNIEERQQVLDAFHSEIFQSSANATANQTFQSSTNVTANQIWQTVDLDDDMDILRMAKSAKNGTKFTQLWEGDHSDYRSQSEAELALCSLLSFWTGQDTDRIDRLFRQSGLFREKWDERHNATGETYGAMTIQKATKNTEVYRPKEQEMVKGADQTLALSCFYEGEFGDAKLAHDRFSGTLLYDHEADRWYSFNRNWTEDRTLDVRASVRQVLRDAYQSLVGYLKQQRQNTSKAAQSSKEDERHNNLMAGIQKRLADLNTLKRIDTIVKILKGGQFFGIRGDEWDRDPWVLGTSYAVIDLRTGESRPSQPEDRIRKFAPTEWKGLDAPAPRWERFIAEIMGEDQDVEQPRTQFLQRLLGYSLLGKQLEAHLPILYGEHGRNGKETLFEVVRHVLGSLAMPLQKELLMESNQRRGGQASPELYDLYNVRIAWISETGDGEKIDAAKAKHLSGNGTIACRQLYSKDITRFEQSHQLFLFTNHKPRMGATDDALWSRIILVPFDMSFVENPTESYHRPIDKHLREKLKAESSGILAWLVRGCLEYHRIGLAIPPVLLDLTKQYRLSEDLISQFLDDCVELCPDKEESVQSSVLYLRYTEWANDNGYRPLSNKRFAEKLPSSLNKVKRKDANYYNGIKLLPKRHS